MQLTHRHIEVFRALMLTGGVTRAAELLHSSQPTVSRELARLEQVTQMQLFERVHGRLRPTARALALHDEVERSFVGLDHIAAMAVALRHFAQGRLALVCLPALAHTLLPEAVRRFRAQHPQAGVAITPLDSPLLEARLTEQRCDLGLVERQEAPPGTELLPLLTADEVAVLPAGHRLAAKRVLRPQDFAGESFINLAPEDAYRQQLDALFERHGIEREQALEAGSAAAVCALVRQGLGIAIVNPLTALEFAGPALLVRRLSVHVPFNVGLVCPSLKPASPLREPFIAALREAAAAVRARLKKHTGEGEGS